MTLDCSIQIIPHKENGWTHIHLFLNNSSWDTQDSLTKKIKSLLLQPGGRKAHVTDPSSLDIEVDYSALETFLGSLSSTFLIEGVRIIEKKILIEKLGGWFDL